MRLRSLFSLGLGMLAAALIYIVPASAVERAPGIYAVSVEASTFMLPVTAVTPVMEHSALTADAVQSLEPDRLPLSASLGPIYALSLQTDAQSLTRFHIRC